MEVSRLVEAVEGAGYSVPTEVIEVPIRGMHCAACVSRVQRVLEGVPGVAGADVGLATESARVTVIPGMVDTLVALGTGSAWLYSVFAVGFPGLFPEGTAHPFFEATAVVIILVVLGQALEARAKGRTS